MKKLIIVDISNYIFRSFYAIRPLNAPDGTPVNAVYGVLGMVYNLIQGLKPTHIVIARDTKEGSFRKEIYKEYKANRTEPPDELKPQFALVDELIQKLKLPEIKMAGYEADDIIGSLAVQWKNEFDEILIASGDKDLMQFVGGPVKILDTMKEKIYQREDVKDKMGVYPEQIVDYLSLIGDSSDNIPGVEGIGPKGAQGLIEEFGNLEHILQNVDKIKNKRCQTALKEHAHMATLSKELVKIVTHLELPHSPLTSTYELTFDQECEDYLNRLGFKSWVSKLAPLKKTSEKQLTDVKTEFELSEDPASLVVTSGAFGVFLKDDYIYLSQNRSAWVLPQTKKTLELLNSKDAFFSLSSAKELLKLYYSHDLEPKFQYYDVMQAHFLLSPDAKGDLRFVASEYLGRGLGPIEGGQGDLLSQGPSAGEKQVCCEYALALLELYQVLKPKLIDFGVTSPYEKLDLPLMKILAKMELQGVSLDCGYYKELEILFGQELEKIDEEIFKVTQDKINLRSPKQVGELLFEKLKLPVIKKTKTGYSTDADVLTELASMNLHPVPELLLKSRELEKLLSTYVRTLPTLVDTKTNKIHTHYQLANAATGRLSSDHPNLQNIPVRTENGRKLRRGFIASPGRVLLSADYSQVELRLLAHFSQDESMLEAFKHERDIHKQTAAEIFEVPLEQVTKEMRNSAKAINFGLMYGQTSFGLSQALKIPQGEAKKYITNYFKKFSSVKIYLDSLKELAESTGYAETLFERKRILPEINSTNRQVKSMAERVAINSPIQGTAADIIKLAMIHIDQELSHRQLKSKMILQVHDELIFDVFPDELEQMKAIVKEKMETAVDLSVVLKVEMGTGVNWYDLK